MSYLPSMEGHFSGTVVECRVPNRHLDVWASGRFSTGTEAGYCSVLYDTLHSNFLGNLISPFTFSCSVLVEMWEQYIR